MKTPAHGAVLLMLALAGAAACAGPRRAVQPVQIQIVADGEQHGVRVPSGTTVADALNQAGISLGPLDRVSPPLFALANPDVEVRVIRVRESFEVEPVTLPFSRQIVRSQALATGEIRVLQAGRNGREEVTYRVITEDGHPSSRTAVKTAVLEAPQDEILMTGSGTSSLTLPVQGTLVYLDAGSAWMMAGSSQTRAPVVASGELDGRVFSLSPNGDWLLYSRHSSTGINALAVVATRAGSAPLDLGTANVVHFADWSPKEQQTLAYSTVDPRPAAPGWKAANDLWRLHFVAETGTLERKQVLAAQVGGRYGWWGTSYAWSPDGMRLAFAQADQVGSVSTGGGALLTLASVTPYQTLSDWAWVPPLGWSPDGHFLFTVLHGPPIGLETAESSPVFDLVAIPSGSGASLTLVPRAGMFANPVASALQLGPLGPVYKIAYLQAMSPLESADSGYRLMVMDRDGSNGHALFPAEGEPGLRPQRLAWSPDGTHIAVTYRGDVWIVEVATGAAQPITADGQVAAIDWK